MPETKETSQANSAVSNTRDELQQKVRQLEESLQRREEELATAEAQRDETLTRLCEAENRAVVERTLHQVGAVDAEAATLLLSRRVDLSGDVTPEELAAAVEQLLLDKPFLRAAKTHMPPATRTGQAVSDAAARIADAAERAVASGNRRDVVEYLRLRRANMK